MKRKPPNTASGVLLHGSLPVEVAHVAVGGGPSCPYRPHPQQYMWLVIVAPHVCSRPALTEANAASTGGGTTTDSLPLQAATPQAPASASRRRTCNDDDTSTAPLNNLARQVVTRSSAGRPP